MSQTLQRFSSEEIPQLFVSQGVHLEILLSSNSENISNLRLQAIQENSELQGYLSSSEDRTEDAVYFIPKNFSWGHLQLTSDAFTQLLESENVFMPYNNLVRRFSSRISSDNDARLFFDTSLTSALDGTERSPVCAELCYNIYHVEKNGRGRGDPWSLRQMGVYQKRDLVTKRSTWIFIQPSSSIRDQVCQTLSIFRLRDNPMLLHVEILFSMASNWAEYIGNLGTKFDKLDIKTSFSKIGETIEYDYPITFQDSQRLHLFRTKLLTALHALQSCQEAAEALENPWRNLQDQNTVSLCRDDALARLKLYQKQIASYSKSVDALLKRSSETSTLLSKIIEYREVEKLRQTNNSVRENVAILKAIAAMSYEENKILKSHSEQAQRDSMILKALALIATIYLPATLVATIFSSNLIQSVSYSSTQSPTHFMVVSGFWIYVLSTLGMTIVTIVSFRLLQYTWSKKLPHG